MNGHEEGRGSVYQKLFDAETVCEVLSSTSAVLRAILRETLRISTSPLTGALPPNAARSGSGTGSGAGSEISIGCGGGGSAAGGSMALCAASWPASLPLGAVAGSKRASAAPGAFDSIALPLGDFAHLNVLAAPRRYKD